jgi:hypothetical protein
MAILPKAIYMFNEIPIKIPKTFITEIEESILKFIWIHNRPWIAKAILAKRAMVEVSQHPTLNYTTETYNKNSMVLAQKQIWRPEEQNRGPDMNPCSYTHLIFDKVTKNIWWRKDSLFNKCCWEKRLFSCRKLKLDPCLSHCISINSKWAKELNIRLETLKLV